MELAYHYALPSAPDRAPLAAIVREALCEEADRCAIQDLRWPAVLERLETLREQGRRSVRIVDAACGSGSLLLAAVRRARALGFLAIEARGVERDAALLARARSAAATLSDPAIDLHFDLGTPEPAMREETMFPADILLYAATPEALASLVWLARRAAYLALSGPTEGVLR
ncbi:hypothetical protein [Sphingomonas sp. TDK1]|uniref:hypothetical protein n=1 Tax=Sphingomonas sp. TDK1 TaxID=453247 RepID=UPI0007D9260C|nr:hypothetical protein [Sphingomonas sp. TDK1]OAN57618.1 hypothetical protein A7X12_07095 [Sphingomonas sp. TDK1]